MEIWLDCVNIDLIRKAYKMGVLSGITTNPAMIAESGQSLEEVLDALLKNQPNQICAQVIATDASSIIEQAETLRDFSDRIIVKIPVTQEGLKAISALSHLQIPIMATTIFTPIQALLACRAGAHYLAPYYSYIEEEGYNSMEILSSMINIIEFYDFDTKIVAASIKNEEQVLNCLQLGIHAVTLKKDNFDLLTEDYPSTTKRLERFAKEWKKAKSSRLFY